MPQFDPSSFPSQFFWLAITIVALYFVMTRMAIPRLANVLEQRQKLIDDDLEQAEKLKAETEAAIAAYEAALAEARAKAHEETKAVTESAAKVAEAKNAEVIERVAKQIKDGENRIAKSRDEALSHVREVAVSVATDMVTKLVGLSLDDAKVGDAVTASMKD
ncbi:MAG: F0F1 ATP synthase subunit B' [Rhodospirillum sp.]|nr:F0F1 ATP synthase subunit B' [Rhodospirillum sp.]